MTNAGAPTSTPMSVVAVSQADSGEVLSIEPFADSDSTLSFTTLIGPEGQRVLIGTDIPIRFFKQLTKYTIEQVVWREAATGEELARSDEFPKMSAGILVTPGYAGLQYFLTADGHIITLQVDPSGSG